MKLVKINVKGISYSETQTGAYALILKEAEGDRDNFKRICIYYAGHSNK